MNVNDIICASYLERPFVCCMSFFDVDYGKICNVRKPLRDFQKLLQICLERRSAATAKVENQWSSMLSKVAEVYPKTMREICCLVHLYKSTPYINRMVLKK